MSKASNAGPRDGGTAAVLRASRRSHPRAARHQLNRSGRSDFSAVNALALSVLPTPLAP